VRPNQILFNDFARELSDALRHGDAERLRGLEMDHEIKLARDLHRQLGRTRALEDARGVAAGDAIVLVDIRAETDQPAGMRIFTIGKDRRDVVARRGPDDLITKPLYSTSVEMRTNFSTESPMPDTHTERWLIWRHRIEMR
jgi:hypothetical protein